MSFIAFEVSLNGDQQYTVGAEEWATIWAHVLAHRIDPSLFPPEAELEGAEIPDQQVIGVNFRASVSIPVKDQAQAETESQRRYSTSKTGSYPGFKLAPGDVVEIKVIETDSADKPKWQERDPRFPGPTIMRAVPESE